MMGAIEGMLRDRMLAGANGYPAAFSDADMRAIAFRLLASTIVRGY